MRVFTHNTARLQISQLPPKKPKDFNEAKNPKLINDILHNQANFFCWRGLKPQDTSTIKAKTRLVRLVKSIATNPQSRSALRTRKVHILREGRLFWSEIKPEEIELDEKFGVRTFELPNQLGEYEFNKHGNCRLDVALSTAPLKGEKSSLNILEIDAYGRNIAYYDIPALLLDKGNSRFLAAHIDCPDLKENDCVSNDRYHLVENDISDVFIDWCKNKLALVLNELTEKEKTREAEKDLHELGNFLQDILEEVSDLLEEDIFKKVFDQKGMVSSVVPTPTDDEGFGGEGTIQKTGGGKRKGGEQDLESTSTLKKSKSQIKILISNVDEDPLNPGDVYEMIERQPVLYQRPDDVEYGIWWINSQKKYIRQIKIREPGAIPFYFFLIKDIILSHRMRNRFKEQERYDPDGLEELNFDLIDELFSKVVERMGIDLVMNESIQDKIRSCIRCKEEFTVKGLAEELGIDQIYIYTFMSNPANNFREHFQGTKQKGRNIKLFTRINHPTPAETEED